jgi:hypothetical protein
VAADHWVDALEKAAGQPAEWVAELGNQIDEIKAAMRAGEAPVDALVQPGKLAESTGGKIDAWHDIGTALAAAERTEAVRQLKIVTD